MGVFLALGVAACTSPTSTPATAPTDTAESEPTGAPPVTNPDPDAPATDPESSATSSDSDAPSPGAVPSATSVDVLVTGLNVPWGLALLPDGTILLTERDEVMVKAVLQSGEVKTFTGQGASWLTANVKPDAEGGLLGLTAVPDTVTATSASIVVYFTASSDNRVALLDLDLSAWTLTNPRVILAGIPKEGIHNGGQVRFGPDGYLYVSTGDAADSELSQKPDSLGGKILRITLDGKPAPGNPQADSPVWTLGHRNVQGLAWTDAGVMYASEFGASAWDELNIIEPGNNYGWPEVEGMGGTDAGFIDPVWVAPPSEASPSGLAILDDVAYLAALRGERLWQIPLAGQGEPQAFFVGEYGRLRAVVPTADGNLLVITNNTSGGYPAEDDDKLLLVHLG